MADAGAFAFVCEGLERDTSLDRLAARGTVRIALKQAGLEPHTITPAQMRVVLEKVLPKELDSRGIADAAGHCHRLAEGLATAPIETRDSPDEVFTRLGGTR